MTKELTMANMKLSFQTFGVSEKDYLSVQELQEVLQRMGGDAFDQEIFEQLWDQCRLNSKGQAKIQQFMEHILLAQSILLQKQRDAEAQIQQLLIETNSVSRSKDYATSKRLNDKIQICRENKASALLSLDILRKLFLPRGGIDRRTLSAAVSEDPSLDVSPDFDFSSFSNLTCVFILTLLLLLLCLTEVFFFNNFLNFIALGLVVSVYFFQYMNRKLILLCVGLIAATIVVDIVWFCLCAKQYGSPSKSTGMFPSFIAKYLEYTLIAFSIVFALKLLLIIFLLAQRDLDESMAHHVNIFTKKFTLSNDLSEEERANNPFLQALLPNKQDTENES